MSIRSSLLAICGGQKAVVTVNQRHGIHARPGAAIAKLTQQTPKPIFFTTRKYGTENIRGSLLLLLQMQLGEGTKVKIEVPKGYPKDIFKNVLEIIKATNTDICHKFMNVLELSKY